MSRLLDLIHDDTDPIDPYASLDTRIYGGSLPVSTSLPSTGLKRDRYLLFSKASGAPCAITGSAGDTQVKCLLGSDLIGNASASMANVFSQLSMTVYVLQEVTSSGSKLLNYRIRLQSDRNKYFMEYDTGTKTYRFSAMEARTSTTDIFEAQLVSDSPGEWTIRDIIRNRFIVLLPKDGTITAGGVSEVCGPMANTIPENQACRFYFVPMSEMGISFYKGQPTLSSSCGRSGADASSAQAAANLFREEGVSSSGECENECQNPQILPTCCRKGAGAFCPPGHFVLASKEKYTSCGRFYPLNAFPGETLLDRQIACCTGKMKGEDRSKYCPQEFCPDGNICRTAMTTFCRNKDNLAKYPECGCFHNDFNEISGLVGGAPQCIDKRCIDPLAYKYNGTENIICNIVNCVIDIKSLSAEKQAVVESNMTQNCRSDSTTNVNQNLNPGSSGTQVDGNNNKDDTNDNDNSNKTSPIEIAALIFSLLAILILIVMFCILMNRRS